MCINCGGCRHFVDEPHNASGDIWDGYCTFVPPATVAHGMGLDHQDSTPAVSVLGADTCSLAVPRGDHE